MRNFDGFSLGFIVVALMFASVAQFVITNVKIYNLKSDIEFLKQTLDKEDSNVIMRHEHMIRTKRFGELTFNDKVFIGE